MGMGEVFIEIRCPNEPYYERHTQCRRDMFGVSLKTLRAHDFSSGPFVDIRICPRCSILYRVTIESMQAIPTMEALPEGEKLETVGIERIFGSINVCGNLPKKKVRKWQ